MDLGVLGGFKVNNAFLNAPFATDGFSLVPRSKFKTIFANDIKEVSYNFWKHNHPTLVNNFVLGSVVDLVKEHKKNHNIFPSQVDLLTGGFPCQDFSVRGLRKGLNSHKSHLNNTEIKNLNETRGKLYLWMKEVIEITKPTIFVAENVKGLANLGDVLDIIKKDFAQSSDGYEIYSRELFAPDFGIPQTRRRIFIIGVNKAFINSNNLQLHADDLFPEPEFSEHSSLFNTKPYPKAKHFFFGLLRPDLTTDMSQKYYSKAKYTPHTQGQTEVNEQRLAPTIRSEHHGNIEFRYLDKISGGKNPIPKGEHQRRLTVRECARIQTFPDELEFVFKSGNKDGLSASAAYKLIGDAVPPLLAYKITNKLEKILLKYS